MKKLNFLFGLATIVATALSFSSCSSEEFGGGNETRGRQVSFTSKVGGSTRTIDDPQSTTVPTGQKIGVFGISDETQTTMTNYKNIEYTVPASGNLTTTNAMTWPTTDGAKVNFYAYAPYNSGWTSHTTAQTFTVASDQSTNDGYLASDLLFATPLTDKTVTTDALALAFKHKLAKLNITLNNTGTEAITISSVKINNTKPSITFTPSDGTLGTEDGTATDITAASNLNIAATSGTANVCAVIVPQPIEANTTLVTITTSDNKTLIAKLSTATTFASEGSYNFTVNITNPTAAKTEVLLSLNSTAVTDWTSNTLGYTLQYGKGDYVMKDGTYKTKAEVDALSDKSDVRAVIFSTDVSTVDKYLGYDAYAMSVRGLMEYKKWNSAVLIRETAANIPAACSDLDGYSITKKIPYASDYSADNYSAFVFTTYTSNNGISGTNNSGWFVPGFGQLVQFLENLGGVTVDKSTNFDNEKFVEATDLVTNLNSYMVNNLFSTTQGTQVISSTESATGTYFAVTINAEDNQKKGYKFHRLTNKNNNNRQVLPCVALKIPKI